MAELRITRLSPGAAPAALGGARSDAARLAQAAFFQNALATTTAPTPARPVTAVQPVTSGARASSSRNGFDARAEPPSRPLRPGSIVDIRV